MKVELSIKDDKELRDVIKDMIRGQITKIAREEIKTVVVQEVMRKIQAQNEEWFIAVIKEQIYEWVKKWSREQWFVGSDQKLTPIVREEMRRVAEKFIVPRLEKEFKPKITDKYIQGIVESIMRNKILEALNLAPTGKFLVMKKEVMDKFNE